MFILGTIIRFRRKFFPTEQEKLVKKYWADGGDYIFRFNYDLNKDSLVLDFGGYQGQWTSDLFSRYCCRIIVFEPINGFAKKIEARFQRNDKIKIFQYGLGCSSRKEVISISANSSSIYRKSSQTEEINIIDAAEWFVKENIKSVQLMKINIEGGEYELLERLIETGLIRIIKNIQVQFHNIERDSTARMKNIQKHLKETHSPTYQYKFVWENWTFKK